MNSIPRLCLHCFGKVPARKRSDAKWCSEKCRKAAQFAADPAKFRTAARERGRKYESSHKKELAIRAAEHRRKHPERIAAAIKKYVAKNPDKRRLWKAISDKRWREKYPEKSRAKTRLYQSRKAAATPDLTQGELDRMAEIYAFAVMCEQKTGIKHHVDHIIPISRGGLHHPSNLRVVPWRTNLRKGNKVFVPPEQIQLFAVLP